MIREENTRKRKVSCGPLAASRTAVPIQSIAGAKSWSHHVEAELESVKLLNYDSTTPTSDLSQVFSIFCPRLKLALHQAGSSRLSLPHEVEPGQCQ
jgi:hypothetical protein